MSDTTDPAPREMPPTPDEVVEDHSFTHQLLGRDRLVLANPEGTEGTEAFNLRRVVVDLVEEYARHTGHADLIRESIDGLVGEDAPS